MDRKKRMTLRGGIFSALVGPALGGVAVALPAIAADSPSVLRHPLEILMYVLLLVCYALIFAGPFGFIAGAAIGWWVAGRVASGVSSKRIYFETASLGAFAGATYPFIFDAVLSIRRHQPVHWYGDLHSYFLPLGAGIGILCATVLASFAGKNPDNYRGLTR